MKTFITFSLFVLFPSIGINSQTADTKLDKSPIKPLNLANHQNNSASNSLLEILHPKTTEFASNNQIKSVTAGNQRLDSVFIETWDDQTVKKVISTKEDLKDHYILDKSLNSNIIYTKFIDVYDYDGNENVTAIVRYYYDETINMIINQSKEDFIYDAKGNNIRYIFSYWNESKSNWGNASKDEYTYDADGNLTSDILSYWDQPDNKWGIGISKKENTYDTDGNLTMYVDFNWDPVNDKFSIKTKNAYAFDSNHKMISDIFSYWDESSNRLLTYSKTVFSYDDKGKETMFDWFLFNQSTSEWNINNRSKFTYDADGNLVSEIDYNWEANIQGAPIYRKDYTYDANGKILKNIDYQWDAGANNYFVKLMEESKYDKNGNKILDSLSGANIAPTKTTFYYSEHVPTAIPMLNDKHIRVYPNPTSEYIIVDLSNFGEATNIKLFDIQGKMVLQQKLSENKQISVATLPKGQYLYKIDNSGNIYTGKILVR